MPDSIKAKCRSDQQRRSVFVKLLKILWLPVFITIAAVVYFRQSLAEFYFDWQNYWPDNRLRRSGGKPSVNALLNVRVNFADKTVFELRPDELADAWLREQVRNY